MSKNEFTCDCNIIHQDAVDKTLKKNARKRIIWKFSRIF